MVEALHTPLGPDRRAGLRPRRACPRRRRRRWRDAIERWQGPILEADDRPDWYKAALFNELYFLVDGGTFWEAGEVGGPEPEPGDPGRFAMLESMDPDYRYYDTVDVDFYASFAVQRLFPELEARGIRDLLAPCPSMTPRPSRSWHRVSRARARSGRCRTISVAPTTTRSTDRTGTATRTSPTGRTSDPSSSSSCGAMPSPIRDGGDSLIRDGWPTVDAVLTRLSEHDRDGDGLPEHAGLPDQTYDTWPMHGPSAYGGSLWLAAVAAAEAMARRLGLADAAKRWEGWFERGQVAFDVRLWRDDHYAYDGGDGPSSDSVMADQLAGQWYADVTGLGDYRAGRPGGGGVAHDPQAQRLWIRRRDDGGGQRHAPGRDDRHLERAVLGGLGRDHLRARRVHARTRLDPGGMGDRSRPAAVTYGRGLWFRTPEAYDRNGDYRASLYLRPLAIWAIEEALERRARTAS